MKKTLFLFATAAIALASCSSDDTIAENMGLNAANEISFRTFVAGNTRAADIVEGTAFTSFKAYAQKNGSTSVYFNEETFTRKSDGTYTSTNKHYWPASGALDFFAYAPATSTQYNHATAQSMAFVVTPSTTVSEQVDLVVANTNNKAKDGTYSASTYGAKGVPLNFRHAESKVVVIFKNLQQNLKFDILAFKIVNVDGSATYTYVAANNTGSTDGKNTDPASSGTTLNVNGWTDNNNSYTAIYTATPAATNKLGVNETTAKYLQDDGTPTTTANEAISMILIPQTTTAVGAYTGNAVGDVLEAGKSYIAVKMIIRNNDNLWDGTGDTDSNTNGTIIADCTGDGNWAVWPIAFTWVPGKKYIYTVDLGDGGYWEKEHVAGDTELDPVLKDTEIKFVDVTVDEWDNVASDVPAAPALP